MDLKDYYRKRAKDYESIYHYDHAGRQQDQVELGKVIKNAMKGKRVLEVACGTGYWTERAAETAENIVGIDSALEMLEIARGKTYGCPTEFRKGDAYSLDKTIGTFDAGLAVCWFSHIPKRRIQEFLRGFHAVLQPGSTVFIADNMHVESLGGMLIVKPTEEDTYKLRPLSDGSQHEVLKNYFTEEELREIFSPYAKELAITMKECFWWIQYTI